MSMKLLLVDDEDAARQRLRRLIADIGQGLAVAGEAADGIEALRLIAATAPDAVLLDIRMPRMDGLAAAREIARSKAPPALIFTTAHDDHAVEAFEVAAVDYLLKPIRRERLETALGRARRFSRTDWDRLGTVLPAPPPRHLCAYAHGEIRLIPVADIVYFRAEAKYTTVRTLDGECLIEDSLVALEQEFGETFLRVHRNALVARDRIAGLVHLPGRSFGLRLRGVAETVEVSRRHLASLRAWLRAIADPRQRD
jgi:two-component system response regulator AlgR